VVRGESRQADDDVLLMVARLANGSMRDALSLLDRLLATGQPRLTAGALEQLLGLPERALVGELIDAAANADAAAALHAAHRLLSTGGSPDQVLTALAERFRDMMVLRACGDSTELVELSDEARRQAVEQARRFDPAGLVHHIALCEAVARSVRSSSFPRALLDALVVRLCMAEKLADVTALIAGQPQPPRQQAAPAPARTGALPVARPGSAAGSAPAKKP
jgi:DNA polymerase-3 subunit gamma/tau